MRRWARIAIAGVAVVVVGAIATGAYALVGGSDEVRTLPGFALVRPLFAQTATTTFPVADAGISAYVQVDSAAVDFDQIITTVFDGMADAGDNYIIGTMAINQGIWLTRTVDVNVYVDTDGWIVAYLTTEKPHAEVFTWTEWNPSGPTLDTTLVRAMEKTAAAIAQAISPTAILLPWLELVAAVVLVFGPWRAEAATLIAGMMILFIVGVSSAVIRGLDINCGCSVSGGTPVSWNYVGFQSLLLAGAVILIITNRTQRAGTEPTAPNPPV